MSWTKIWVHLVFSTKYRHHFLDDKIRNKVFFHIKENAELKGIHIDVVNGYFDHAHCLICLGREQSIGKVVQLIKGESAYWINRNKLTERKFIWQDDDWAESVNEESVGRVRNYILNQETHHREQTFKEEINRFAKKYNWPPI